MKKLFTIGFILLVVAMTSCTDLTGVNNRLDDHEKRLKALEGLVANANSNIQTLQKLLDAEAGKITITNWNETPEGYVLTMSDGSKITLTHGKDGSSPAVGVKDFNGVLYWTLNGEFLLDADGNKIKAEGQDGTSGITPKIRVDAEGYWEVSLDGGKTWQAVTDTNGQKVKAVGSDASIDLVITEDDKGIKIVYDGKEFIIPKTGGGTTPEPVVRPLLAIDYLSEYNINQEGDAFVNSQANEVSGYFTWDDAMAKFSEDKSFQINGKIYYLPSQMEWRSIVPNYNDGKNIRFNANTTSPADYSEEVSVGGSVGTYKADYVGTDQNVSYGHRYKASEMESAWRYEYIDNPDKSNLEEDDKCLKITVRYLGKDSGVTISEISTSEYWSSNSSDDIIRIIPASGFINDKGEKEFLGVYGSYWSSIDFYTSYARVMHFNKEYANPGSFSAKILKLPVRLFEKK